MKNHRAKGRIGNRTLSRRSFLRSSALVAGAATVGAPAIVRGQNLNERLDIAIIGAGGRGGGNWNAVHAENITVVCDVDETKLTVATKRAPKARQEIDFRKVYDKPDEFDAVVVSTCEHTHAFATLPALQLGKHVYCEKPLTHSVWEARVIREAAAKANVATQMGTQIHAGDNYRRVVELIQTGAIGAVSEAHVWLDRAWGWHASKEEADAAKDIVFVQERPAKADPIPETLNWDLWIGPAPMRPFNNVYFPGPKWYRWWDFGNGTMSDMGSHMMDLPFWALKLHHPLTIEAQGPPPHAEIAPASMQADFEYGPRGDLPPVTVSWYQGLSRPTAWKEKKIPRWNMGILFVGDKGMLLSDYGKHVLLPKDEFKDFERPEPFIPKSLGHHAEWVHACKTGDPTTCNFDYAGWLTEANHLGNVAYRVGKRLTWDPEKLCATDVPEADPLIRREYREGWKLA